MKTRVIERFNYKCEINLDTNNIIIINTFKFYQQQNQTMYILFVLKRIIYPAGSMRQLNC